MLSLLSICNIIIVKFFLTTLKYKGQIKTFITFYLIKEK